MHAHYIPSVVSSDRIAESCTATALESATSALFSLHISINIKSCDLVSKQR